MKLTPTSITLFLVEIGTFFSELIVAICCGLYVSSYPKSSEATSLSGIAIGTFAFAILSTLATAVLILRQKYGKTMRAIFESAWVIFATTMWILAAIGGIAYPPNGMSNVSCKILPNGTETSDPNYTRACQSMFASTAFCIVTALFYIATMIMLFVYSVKRTYHDRKSKKKQVGGHYKLSMTPSQYRRSEKEVEEGKNLKGAGEHEEDEQDQQQQQQQEEEEEERSGAIKDGHFTENVYKDPMVSNVPVTHQHHMNLQQQQHQQQQYLNQHQQQQSLWNQQPAYTPY
ncbi:hypothetical protein BX616_001478 [Lobosporangium transversale]|uniref:MARVEL domain-containing protein n=1 Tax=Lobosporangium transversale TaxID=64571 RepID=A0A1Y2GE57_9FUNG|nr:hypothetical protein BCR41DRAFT_362097 [Lobosporangium transversale]KAF9903936.1 hypothetical protein BX616_001478 [Lobosporangium transversale]ORZ05196.1 hypothetical protein BCR41DRAFT_362097 [Lobosporangium transversale]|eukprot:XP_021876971.1 hypothetical protein BCR41DRAFT_362097 [Lobosporangium transversale]